jgi:hypothetical protein
MHRRTVKTPAYIAGLRLTWLWLVLGMCLRAVAREHAQATRSAAQSSKAPNREQIISTLLTLRKAQNPTLVSMRALLCEVRHDD